MLSILLIHLAEAKSCLLHLSSSQGLQAEGLRFRVIDARGQVVGRLASQIAKILTGKDKPTYRPNQDCGDAVVVVNASQVEFTGRKWDNKLYRWHTGYPGGLKERSAKDQEAREPGSVLQKAVMGMLPKTNLRRVRGRGGGGGVRAWCAAGLVSAERRRCN